jgi:hypothetical protein
VVEDVVEDMVLSSLGVVSAVNDILLVGLGFEGDFKKTRAGGN